MIIEVSMCRETNVISWIHEVFYFSVRSSILRTEEKSHSDTVIYKQGILEKGSDRGYKLIRILLLIYLGINIFI